LLKALSVLAGAEALAGARAAANGLIAASSLCRRPAWATPDPRNLLAMFALFSLSESVYCCWLDDFEGAFALTGWNFVGDFNNFFDSPFACGAADFKTEALNGPLTVETSTRLYWFEGSGLSGPSLAWAYYCAYC